MAHVFVVEVRDDAYDRDGLIQKGGNRQSAADRVPRSQQARRGLVQQNAGRRTVHVPSEACPGEDLDSHDVREIRSYTKGLDLECILTEPEWSGVLAARAGGGRNACHPLDQSRPGIDLAGEAFDLQRIEGVFGESQYHSLAVEPQVGVHEVELPRHGDRHYNQEGRHDELQDDQTAADAAPTELWRTSAKGPDGVVPRDDPGRIQAGEQADGQSQGQGPGPRLEGQPIQVELTMCDLVEGGQQYFGQGHAPDDGDQTHDDGLGQELAGELGARGADHLSHADFEGARNGACQGEVDEVDDGDQEHDSGQACQQVAVCHGTGADADG